MRCDGIAGRTSLRPRRGISHEEVLKIAILEDSVKSELV